NARSGGASRHNQNSTAHDSGAIQNCANGAKASGRAAPAPNAASAVMRRARVCRRPDAGRGSGGRARLKAGDFQRVDAAAIAAVHPETEAAEFDLLAAARQPPELVHHEAADGVVFLVAQAHVEILVEVLDTRQSEHV